MYIDYDAADSVATITLNRPEAANAQNSELLDELDAGLRDLSDQIQQAHFVTQLPAFSFAVPERSEDAYGH